MKPSITLTGLQSLIVHRYTPGAVTVPAAAAHRELVLGVWGEVHQVEAGEVGGAEVGVVGHVAAVQAYSVAHRIGGAICATVSVADAVHRIAPAHDGRSGG